MKNNSLLIVISLLFGLFGLASSCGPEPPPPKPPKPPIPLSVTDIDGNIYHIKLCGSILWMTENLRVTKYDTESSRSGNTIPVATSEQSVNINKPYCVNVKDVEDAPYTDNFTEEIRSALGLLYNWSAATGMEKNDTLVNGSKQGICPNGWRLPIRSDLDSLFKYLGGKELADDKLKSTSGWYLINGTNESGLNCYPAGLAVGNQISAFAGRQTMFWCSGNYGTNERDEVFRLFYNEPAEMKFIDKYQASSVRCVKSINLEDYSNNKSSLYWE